MQYSVKGSDGNTYGPVDIQTLKLWAAQGRVTPQTMVTDVLSQQEMVASSIPELGLNGNFIPPVAYADYTRPNAGVQVQQGTRLWAILFWLALAIVLGFFTTSGGIIISGWNIFDAFSANKRGDKYGKLSIAVAIFGFLVILLWTMAKTSAKQPTS